MQQEDITVKGIRQGLLIGLGEGRWGDQLALLERRLSLGADFFRGGRAVLDVGDRELSAREIEHARVLLARYKVKLWALLSPCDDTALAAARQGLAVNLDLADSPDNDMGESAASSEEAIAGALLVERTLRSGQRVHHLGHVVVIGDVHAGAEVIAGGHVVVWGKLKGLVHAGALGDEGAVVCALDLAPTQLRIAGRIARSPDEKTHRPMPEMARMREGRIEAVPWHQQREGSDVY
ncbi:MAG: septum site-determining protein MinC [Anaerolineae bacterium]|jgi:septum site-determining protein MinC